MAWLKRFGWLALGAMCLAGIGLAWRSTQAAGATPLGDCTAYWGPPQSSEAPYFPELNAVYWSLRYDATAPQAQNVAFRLTAQFPYARNTSLHFYPNLNVGSADNSLRDVDIAPDAGSINPYLPGVNRQSTNRAYTAWLVPADSVRVGQPNTLVISADSDIATLMLRVYRADYGRDNGGVPLPAIQAVDDDTGLPVACPPNVTNPPLEPVDLGAWPPASKQVSFYHLSGEGYYPNDDKKYLVAVADPSRFGQILILRFYPPTFLDTYQHPSAVFTGNEEVRFMSLCIGGKLTTRTSQCVADDQFIQANSGYFNVVVGPDRADVRAAAQARGYNFIVWYSQSSPALIYRHMRPLSSFEGSLALVPVYNPKRPTAGQRAEDFIGQYAPIGRYCSVNKFLSGSTCGMPSP